MGKNNLKGGKYKAPEPSVLFNLPFPKIRKIRMNQKWEVSKGSTNGELKNSRRII